MQTFRLITKRPGNLFIFFFGLFGGCKKDFIDTTQSPTFVNPPTTTNRSPISQEEARNWFRSQFGNKKQIQIQNANSTLEFDIKPVWAFSLEGVYGDSIPIPIVFSPVQRITPCDFGNRGAYFLLFYKDYQDNIQSRLVICVGDSTYSDGTKPKTFSDFSGRVFKMDLDGVFQQRVSFIQDGQSIFDFFPNPDSTGTIVWSYEDFFLEGSFGGSGGEGLGGASGLSWYDPTIMYWDLDHNLVINTEPLHIFTFHYPFGFVNAGHNNSGGSNNTGTGNTTNNPNTGTSLELYHFTNLYNNPMFQITEYFENMGLNGQAYQIFGFLNSEARQFLANEQDFIDIFYDFLTSRNNSLEARDIVNKIIEIILETNVSTRPDFNSIITNWLGNDSPYISQHSAIDLIDIYNAVATNNVISTVPIGPILELPGDLDDCFDNACTTCTHKVTVYVEQPVPGTRDLWSIYTHSGGSSGQSSSVNAGHSFLSLEQTAPNGNKTVVTLGFYPLGTNHGCGDIPGATREEDNNSVYNMSVGWDVSLEDFKKIKNGWNNWQSPSTFNNCNRNCTSAVIYSLNQGGLNVPSTSAGYHFPVGTFTVNPADLGEDLRANPLGGTLNFSTQLSNLTNSQISTCH